MGSTTNRRFMEKLLAPIPANEEPVDTPEFRKLIAGDMMRVWLAGMEHVRRAEAMHTIAAIDRKLSGEPIGFGPKERANLAAFQGRCRVEEAQCLIPAPTAAELRWKKRVTKYRKVPQGVADAIAADEARLVGGAT